MGAVAAILACGAMAQPAPKARAPKTPAEAQALNAVFQAASPDARIAAAEDFVVKFPESDFKAVAFYAEAQS